jgi:hypothetical protein
MIYIITGVAKSGKSLLARQIKEEHQVSIISTDDLMMALYKDYDIDINASDSSVSYRMEPYLLKLIKDLIKKQRDILIEGVHFNPAFSRKILDMYTDDIKILYMGYKDISQTDKVNELLKYKHMIKNQWIYEEQFGPIEETVQYLIHESQRIYQDCALYHLDYYEVTDIQIDIRKIIDYLFES